MTSEFEIYDHSTTNQKIQHTHSINNEIKGLIKNNEIKGFIKNNEIKDLIKNNELKVKIKNIKHTFYSRIHIRITD